jgi:predicted PolB exonuclease-like 3'-5' exonuclease
VLSDQGASASLSLEEAASAIGLPGKRAGHGAAVAELLAAGETDRIDRYCEGNVLNTYALYLRWAYFSSRLSARGHNASVDNLVNYLENAWSERPQLGEFLDTWQASRRPCPLYVPEPAMEPSAQPPESHLRSEDVLP